MTTTIDRNPGEQHSAEAVARVLIETMDPLQGRGRALALSTYRLLAAGSPVEVKALAHATGASSAEVEGWLEGLSGVFRDERGRIVGFWGLAVGEMPHRFEVGGVPLFAWCAWDTLFMPALIGSSASVSSQCQTTGADVRLVVAPDGVISVSPADAVVSMLVPPAGFDSSVMQSFCHHVHFFASTDAGRAWLAEREDDDAFLLSVGDAFRLGQLWNEHRFGTIESGS